MTGNKPETIDEYIDAAPPEGVEKLKEIRAILKDVAPKATESIKWGSPIFEEKRILFAFTAFRNHLNFTPTRATIKHFQNKLSGFRTGMDSVNFPYQQSLPHDLIRDMAIHRAWDVRENDAHWKVK